MQKIKKSKLTVDRLFEITAEEFSTVHEEIGRVDKKVDFVIDELKELKEINKSMLVAVSVLTEHAMEKMEKRLDRIEKHIGLTK